MVSKSSLTQNSKMRSNSHLLLERTSSTLCSMEINLNLESTTSHSLTCGTMRRPRDTLTTKTKKHMIHTKLRITANTTKLQLKLQVGTWQQPMANDHLVVMTTKYTDIRVNLDKVSKLKESHSSSSSNLRGSSRMFSTTLTTFPQALIMDSTGSLHIKSNQVKNMLNQNRRTLVLSKRRKTISLRMRIKSKKEVDSISTSEDKINTKLSL
jgi:hypothetical protein